MRSPSRLLLCLFPTLLACQPAEAPVPKTRMVLPEPSTTTSPSAPRAAQSIAAAAGPQPVPTPPPARSQCHGTDVDLDLLSGQELCTVDTPPVEAAPSGPNPFTVTLAIDQVTVARGETTLIPVVYTNSTDQEQRLTVGMCRKTSRGGLRVGRESPGHLLSDNVQTSVHSPRTKNVDILPAPGEVYGCVSLCEYRGVRVTLAPRGKATALVAYSPTTYRPHQCDLRRVGSLPVGAYTLELPLPRGTGRYDDRPEIRTLALVVK